MMIDCPGTPGICLFLVVISSPGDTYQYPTIAYWAPSSEISHNMGFAVPQCQSYVCYRHYGGDFVSNRANLVCRSN